MIIKLNGYPISEEMYLDTNNIVCMSREAVGDAQFTIITHYGRYNICGLTCSFDSILSLWTKDEFYDMTNESMVDSDGCILICWEIEI